MAEHGLIQHQIVEFKFSIFTINAYNIVMEQVPRSKLTAYPLINVQLSIWKKLLKNISSTAKRNITKHTVQ